MISLRHTALGLALSLAFTGQALAVTTIPFWHSMEGELGKEVDSLAQRFNQAIRITKSFRSIRGTMNRT